MTYDGAKCVALEMRITLLPFKRTGETRLAHWVGKSLKLLKHVMLQGPCSTTPGLPGGSTDQ